MKKCVICGANVRRMNPKANICSPTCRKARDAGISLEDQIRRETDLDIPYNPTRGDSFEPSAHQQTTDQ